MPASIASMKAKAQGMPASIASMKAKAQENLAANRGFAQGAVIPLEN